ncbi:cobaltochelatase subunit CobN [Acetobacteraceae bacterium H6797]|nr:cobaltochelatase subunit CobN [Acetobacteraceae bacterium H6797]
MHILATTSATLEDLAEPVDLGQEPAELVALSFSDSDLLAMQTAWPSDEAGLPRLCLTPLRELRHPMSVDLWIDRIASQAKAILVRLLGGYDWWPYGCDRLVAVARERGIPLILLPGECSEDDERLRERSTVPDQERLAILACFREGGPANMRVMLARMARLAGIDIPEATASPLPKAGFYAPGRGVLRAEDINIGEAAVVPVIFYRSILLAGDTAPVDALCEALSKRALTALPIFVPSLRDEDAVALLDGVMSRVVLRAIITTTAFSASQEPGIETLFDRYGLPVFQAIIATTRQEAWAAGQRGLTPADIAMHVILPELDGRILAGALSFKAKAEAGATLLRNTPEVQTVEAVADRIAKSVELCEAPRAARRLIILLPDYPGAEGRAGYAVGLDVPSSVLAILSDLRDAGYAIDDIPATPRDLMRALDSARPVFSSDRYLSLLGDLPAKIRDCVEQAWGSSPQTFAFRYVTYGNVTVALPPDRGDPTQRRAQYHDAALPPSHDLLAFGFWLREDLGCHAILHVGAHGTFEWLPGKTVALSPNCFPKIVTGNLPVIYPFIVSNPGEAAQAKRRIGAVTLGHLPPPLVGAGLDDAQRELERLVDEYAQSDGLDARRKERLAKLIVRTAAANGLAREAGVATDDSPDTALQRIDAWLCDIKDFAIKDGLHIYGRGGDDEPRTSSAAQERQSLLDALDGKHIRPGPSGSPSRGREDVLPTGRNLYTIDPRTLPTRTACDLAAIVADEVLRHYQQEHGEWPRSLVMDLWGSASLRTGGEEIAQGLALMGCRPQWDEASGRVIGIEVLPPAVFGRPRVDVTWRISGLFRDLFPSQIALLDTAVAAVAARDEEDHDNPLAALRRSGQPRPARIFGAAPGSYGAGIERRLASGQWDERSDLGQDYLDSASHGFRGADGEGAPMPDAFAQRVASADLLLHGNDDASRDILEGSAHVAFIGGFAAALAKLGGKADLVVLDNTNPSRPRARSLVEAITLTVRARAINPRFIAGQMRHGPRGASEFAETVDRLIGFAETTEAVPQALIDAVYTAYLGDEAVRRFLLNENPAAAASIAKRFASARRRGLWHPRRNGIDEELEALLAESQP